MIKSIQQLPSRYEPLVKTLGEKTRTTFFEQNEDIQVVKRLLVQARSSNQSKWMFVYHPAESGAGKTTFVHSAAVFLPDDVEAVVRLPEPRELALSEVPQFLGNIPVAKKSTIINFDQHESLSYDEGAYRSILVQLNAILRNRSDLVVLWPVNDLTFASKLVAIQKKIGGMSAFGAQPIYTMKGLEKEKFKAVFERILKVANWTLEDAALDWSEIDGITKDAINIGGYLDAIQTAIAARFDIGKIGFVPPQVVLALSSGKREVRDICRNLRRADSYYLEASRLLMYTKRSNVAEWWQERNKELSTGLPYVIALFNAQLLSISGAGVVHSVMNFGPSDLSSAVEGVTKNLGNAKRVISSTELYKFSLGQEVDSREYGLTAKEETLGAFAAIQAVSKTRHRDINNAVMRLIEVAGGGFTNVRYEQPAGLTRGLLVDVVAQRGDSEPFLEFHHKAESETDNNGVAIYILTKLKEYAINYKLAKP